MLKHPRSLFCSSLGCNFKPWENIFPSLKSLVIHREGFSPLLFLWSLRLDRIAGSPVPHAEGAAARGGGGQTQGIAFLRAGFTSWGACGCAEVFF